MHADLLIANIGQIVSPSGTGPRRGRAMRDLDVIDNAAIAVTAGRLSWIGPWREWTGDATRTIDAEQCAVIPALIDPHTHAIWAGDRLDDFDARTAGATYQDILAAGGGIRHTIAATAALGPAELAALALPRVQALMRSGAATVEIKSGYGFTADAELRSLEAIRLLSGAVDATIVPTLLIHVPPADQQARPEYLTMVNRELLPAVAERQLAVAVDVFIEREAFSAAEGRRVLATARTLGLATKAHVDQFHSIGGVMAAIENGALSVDHLEATTEPDIAALAASDTVAVILPGVTLHLGILAAPGRALIDAGCIVAVGTDLNPGSSPVFSTQLAMALAVRLNGLTAAEALVAATANAAHALGFSDRGRLQTGARADLLVTQTTDWRDVAYTMGANPIDRVIIAGREVEP